MMYILILKSTGEWLSSADEDPYVETLKKHGFDVDLVETLDFVYHTSTISEYKNWRDNHSCIVFTSPRAVTAYVKAGLKGTENDLCFVVGPSTESQALEAGFLPKGANSGDAANLASFIIDNYSSQLTLPIFFPAAQGYRDVLPKAMESKGFKLNIVIAYTSEENKNLRDNVRQLLENKKQMPNCFVFFSPSGVTLIEDILQIDLKPHHDEIKFIAMGRSTAAKMEELGLTVAGVAISPKPDSLLKLVKLYK